MCRGDLICHVLQFTQVRNLVYTGDMIAELCWSDHFGKYFDMVWGRGRGCRGGFYFSSEFQSFGCEEDGRWSKEKIASNERNLI